MTLTLTIGPWRLQLNIGRAPEPEQHQPAPPIHIDTPMAIYAEPVEQHCGFQQPMEAS